MKIPDTHNVYVCATTCSYRRIPVAKHMTEKTESALIPTMRSA